MSSMSRALPPRDGRARDSSGDSRFASPASRSSPGYFGKDSSPIPSSRMPARDGEEPRQAFSRRDGIANMATPSARDELFYGGTTASWRRPAPRRVSETSEEVLSRPIPPPPASGGPLPPGLDKWSALMAERDARERSVSDLREQRKKLEAATDAITTLKDLVAELRETNLGLEEELAGMRERLSQCDLERREGEKTQSELRDALSHACGKLDELMKSEAESRRRLKSAVSVHLHANAELSEQARSSIAAATERAQEGGMRMVLRRNRLRNLRACASEWRRAVVVRLRSESRYLLRKESHTLSLFQEWRLLSLQTSRGKRVQRTENRRNLSFMVRAWSTATYKRRFAREIVRTGPRRYIWGKIGRGFAFWKTATRLRRGGASKERWVKRRRLRHLLICCFDRWCSRMQSRKFSIQIRSMACAELRRDALLEWFHLTRRRNECRLAAAVGASGWASTQQACFTAWKRHAAVEAGRRWALSCAAHVLWTRGRRGIRLMTLGFDQWIIYTSEKWKRQAISRGGGGSKEEGRGVEGAGLRSVWAGMWSMHMKASRMPGAIRIARRHVQAWQSTVLSIGTSRERGVAILSREGRSAIRRGALLKWALHRRNQRWRHLMIGHMEDRRHISLVSCYFALWIDGIERAISRRNVKETIVDLQNVTTDSLHEQVVISFLRRILRGAFSLWAGFACFSRGLNDKAASHFNAGGHIALAVECTGILSDRRAFSRVDFTVKDPFYQAQAVKKALVDQGWSPPPNPYPFVPAGAGKNSSKRATPLRQQPVATTPLRHSFRADAPLRQQSRQRVTLPPPSPSLFTPPRRPASATSRIRPSSTPSPGSVLHPNLSFGASRANGRSPPDLLSVRDISSPESRRVTPWKESPPTRGGAAGGVAGVGHGFLAPTESSERRRGAIRGCPPKEGGYTPRTSAGPTHSSSRRRPSPSPRQAHTESASPSQASFTAALGVETRVPLGSPLRPLPGDGGWWKDSKYAGFEDESSIDGDDEDEVRRRRRRRRYGERARPLSAPGGGDGDDDDDSSLDLGEWDAARSKLSPRAPRAQVASLSPGEVDSFDDDDEDDGIVDHRRSDRGKVGDKTVAIDARHGGRGREGPDFGGKTSERRGSYTSGRNSEGIGKGRNP